MSTVDIAQAPHIELAFNSPPVYNAAFSYLSPPDLIRFGKTCRLLREAINDFHDLAYNINRHLDRFVKDPITLRRQQLKTGFLISGSNALQFLDRTCYAQSDLDIYAYSTTIKGLGHYLIQEEGYRFEPSEKQAKNYDDVKVVTDDEGDDDGAYFGGEDNPQIGMSDVLRFKHPTKELEIQLICCLRSPLDCILHFHSTCVMNFITYDKAYSLYPRATFDKRLSIAFIPNTYPLVAKAYGKYSARGWKVLEWNRGPSMKYRELPSVKRLLHQTVIRYPDDQHTWVVPLNTSGLVDDKATPSIEGSTAAFHCNSWVIGKDQRKFLYVVLVSEEFQYAYLIAAGNPIASDIKNLDPECGLMDQNGVKYLDSFLSDLRHGTFPSETQSETNKSSKTPDTPSPDDT